jgi:GrpB-like predicted nucleotidyltransferase (UPF0157 family)
VRHPEAREQYAQLKRILAAEYEFNREKYTDAKSEFVVETVEKARSQRAKKKGR